MQLIDSIPLIAPASLVSLRNRTCFIAGQLGLSEIETSRLASVASELGDIQLQQHASSQVALGIMTHKQNRTQLCLRFSPWPSSNMPPFLRSLPYRSRVLENTLECCQYLPENIRADAALCGRLAEDMQRHVLPSRAELEMLATHDGLTRLLNRGTLNNRLTGELRRAKRYRYPLSLIMMDIDHFKHINDNYGHQAGDACLVTVSEIARDLCREQEIVARYGGEEFVIVMPHTDLAHGLNLAERLRQTIANTPVIHQQQKIRCTISIGITQMRQDDDDNGSTLIARADQALYKAKETGRNRVCVVEDT